MSDIYQGQEIAGKDYQVLKELELLIGKQIPVKDEFKEGECVEIGVKIENKHIVALGLYNCGLKELPDSLVNLKHIEILVLNCNKFVEFPKLITELVSLKELYLYSIRFKSLTDSIGNLKSLEILDLSDNKLEEIPDSISELKSLQKLWLHFNSLIGLPETVGKLESLMILDLRGNQLSSIPESIGNLLSLEFLDLGTNKLSIIPDSIGNLKSIKTLWLLQNYLSDLPESIRNLRNLEDLCLMGNFFKKLPESICKLLTLKRLDLEHNKIATLPKCIGNLTNLECLNLQFNKLTSLPVSFTNFKFNIYSLCGNKLNDDAFVNLGNAYIQKSRYTDANWCFEYALDTRTHQEVQDSPNPEKALEGFKKIVELDPKNARAWHGMSMIYGIFIHQPDEAKMCSEKYSEYIDYYDYGED